MLWRPTIYLYRLPLSRVDYRALIPEEIGGLSC